jgi:hypothetical protein
MMQWYCEAPNQSEGIVGWECNYVCVPTELNSLTLPESQIISIDWPSLKKSGSVKTTCYASLIIYIITGTLRHFIEKFWKQG